MLNRADRLEDYCIVGQNLYHLVNCNQSDQFVDQY